MIDITHKRISLRTAKAEAWIRFSESTGDLIASQSLPKGDPFGIAKAAAFLACKQTPFLIPHCHPVSVDGLDIQFELFRDCIRIHGEAKSISRTGIEMEVLTSVSMAALTLYDLLKPVDKQLIIDGIQLLDKTGGKTQEKSRDSASGLKGSILTISDSCSRGISEDRSGPLIKARLEKEGLTLKNMGMVSDDTSKIVSWINQELSEGVDFIFTTGGTGLGPRDVTIEALRSMEGREVPGVSEAMRKHGQDRNARAMLSRSLCMQMGQSMVLALPGSAKGAVESLDAVLPALFHARLMMDGGGH